MELKGLDIEEVDYHGIKQLLMPLLPKSGINLADVTNDIIGANFVGHVIKQVDEVNQFADDEDPVLSITTMVPLGKQSWFPRRSFLSRVPSLLMSIYLKQSLYT